MLEAAIFATLGAAAPLGFLYIRAGATAGPQRHLDQREDKSLWAWVFGATAVGAAAEFGSMGHDGGSSGGSDGGTGGDA